MPSFPSFAGANGMELATLTRCFFVKQPAEVKEIKTFLEYARRKDARQVTIKKSAAKKAGAGQVYKFKLRCSKYLYTFSLRDADKAEKLRQSLPPTLKVNDVDGPVKAKK
ncbi:60S ribosomal protein L38 [Rhodotorula toruloides]